MDFQTKYGGSISNEELILYLKRLIGKVFKIMPMKEENDTTLELYLYKLMTQLAGGNRLIIPNDLFMDVLFNLEKLKDIDNIEIHNSIVKECINLCNKIIKELEG